MKVGDMQNGDMNFITEQSRVFYSLLIKFVSPVLLYSLPKCFVSPVLRGDMNFFSEQSFIFYSLIKQFVSPVNLTEVLP